VKTVEILLREHIGDLGKCGDIVRVKSGYARNYLLPQRLAVAATPDNMKAMERRRLRLDAEEAEQMAAIETRILVIQGATLTTTQKADENGHLYGSVNAGTVVELLASQGKKVEEKDVRIDKPIKAVGAHTVRIHVHAERYAEVTVEVQPEGGMPAAAATATEGAEADA
jgi:large subunit ribosomal protein L9